MQENEGELDREQLIRSHIIHEFDRDRVLRNMHGCYGQIMQRFYSRLLHQVVGGRLLDVGCGFGQFGALGSTRGLEVHSIDIDDAALAVARSLFGPHYWHESVYATT